MATTAAVTRVIEIDVRQSATAQQHVASMAKSLGSIEETSKKTQASVKSLASEFQGMASGMVKGLAFAAVTTGIVSAVAAIRDMADESQVLRSRLEQVLGSTEKAGAAFMDVTRISVAQGQSMQAVGTLYEKIGRQAENLGVTTKGITLLTEGFAASLRLSGAGTEQAQAAILQFSQALASGKLAGDEFKSMMENNSVFMYELAKAAGVTQAQLKKMSKDGEVDLEFLRKALFTVGKDGKTALDTLIDNAAKLPMTFKQAREGVWAELQNLVDALLNTANKSESIFTRMAKAVAVTLGQAAREVRLFAGVKAARAGEEAAAAMPDKTDAERLNEHSESEIRRLMAQNNQLIRDRDAMMNDFIVGRSNPRAFADRRKVFDDQIEANMREIQYRNKELAAYAESIKKIDIKDTLDPAWRAPPKEPKKEKKGPGEPKIAEDAMEKFYDDITKKQSELEDAMSGMGPNMVKFMSAEVASNLDKSKDQFGNYTNQLFKLAKEAAERADEIFLSDKAVTARNKEVERVYTENLQKLQAGFKKWEKVEDKTRTSQEVYDDARVELEELIRLADQLGQTTISTHLTSELNHLQVGFEKVGKQAKTVGEEIRDAMIDSTKEMADAILDFTTGTEASFGKMLARILRQIASAQLQKALNPLMSQAGGFISTLIGGFFGSGGNVGGVSSANGGISASTVYGPGSGWGLSALGNVFGPSGKMKFFANGGIVNGATGFAHVGGMGIMGEAGPEAIMPLQRDASGKLGVGTAPVSIEINNYSGAQISQTESVDPNGNKRISILVEKAVENGLATGRFDKTMRSSFGLARQGR